MPERTIEIRLHGRGGQGTVTMAALLVDAAARAGWFPLGFPSFGTERTGAPVAAFVRLGDAPVRDRSEVRHPSILVVQDPTLIASIDLTAGLAENGLVILNATEAPSGLDARVVTVPASALAMAILGKPITSTAMLGAFCAATDLIGIDDVCAAIEARFAGALGARNAALARAAYNATQKVAVIA